jgi:hypothetical protein
MRKAPDGYVPDPVAVEQEITSINVAIDAFAASMKAAMARKAREGRTGWNDPALRPAIVMDLMAHAIAADHTPGQEIHVANFAMMLHTIELLERALPALDLATQ